MAVAEEVDIMEQINRAKWMPYPLFDKFKKEDVDHLIGPAKVPPILRPIQLTLVPDHVGLSTATTSVNWH